jgi:hypothetical protein
MSEGPVHLTLEELRRRLDKAQEVVVDQHGTLRPPNDPAVKDKDEAQKTTLKPSRWYAA